MQINIITEITLILTGYLESSGENHAIVKRKTDADMANFIGLIHVFIPRTSLESKNENRRKTKNKIQERSRE